MDAVTTTGGSKATATGMDPDDGGTLRASAGEDAAEMDGTRGGELSPGRGGKIEVELGRGGLDLSLMRGSEGRPDDSCGGDGTDGKDCSVTTSAGGAASIGLDGMFTSTCAGAGELGGRLGGRLGGPESRRGFGGGASLREPGTTESPTAWAPSTAVTKTMASAATSSSGGALSGRALGRSGCSEFSVLIRFSIATHRNALARAVDPR
jgi:hypothetical protein